MGGFTVHSIIREIYLFTTYVSGIETSYGLETVFLCATVFLMSSFDIGKT